MEEEKGEGERGLGEGEEEWPVHPWGAVIAGVIESSLGSLSLDELNFRMEVSRDCL